MISFLFVSTCILGIAQAAGQMSDPSAACSTLKSRFANNTLLPEDDQYQNETQVSWSAAAWMKPACIFLPDNATQLSQAVKLFKESRTLFAMRGGGHMSIPTAANIGLDGILISSTNLNSLDISSGGETMSISPGARWGDVYNYMNNTNRTVIGGRLGSVGVPGLLLGGGVSFYSYNVGLGASGGKILSYECVLADGSIATATSQNEHQDLYWALQGGGNSFALVTKFELQTFYSEAPLIAEASYGIGKATKSAFLDAVSSFAVDEDPDPFAAITPLARWFGNSTPETGPVYLSTLFYNGSQAPSQGPFTAFVNETATALAAIDGSSRLERIPLATYANLSRTTFEAGGESYGLRQKFHVIGAKASRQALEVIHDEFFATLMDWGRASDIEGFATDVAFNPTTKRFIERSTGSAYSIPPHSAFWPELSVTWKNAEDDDAIEGFLARADSSINDKLRTIGAELRYLYLNDAGEGQAVFKGYGKSNLQKLKAIRDVYDPDRVFTDLMPGGWKVAHA